MELVSLVIVGSAVSLLVQWLKHFTLGSWRSQLILIGISLLAGLGYLFFKTHQNYWLIVLEVIVAANTFYSFVIKYVETKQSNAPTV